MGKSSKRSRGAAAKSAPSSNGNGRQQNGSATDNVRHRPADPPRQQFQSPQAQQAANIGSTLIHFGIVWLIVGVLVKFGQNYRDGLVGAGGTGGVEPNVTGTMGESALPPSRGSTSWGGYSIPSEMMGPMPSYPDPLGITDEMRKNFHAVVVFPQVWADVADSAEDDDNGNDGKKGSGSRREKVANYELMDHTQSMGSSQLVEESEWTERIRQRKKSGVRIPHSVGRYDENRPSMYSSDLFLDETNSVGGYDGGRTVHIGIDLGAPVGTKVHAFTDGIVHSAGHNPDLGDYGHVVVVEHRLPPLPSESTGGEGGGASEETRKVWALYGHLDKKSIRGKAQGKRIKKGQVLGRIGDINENGGWSDPHVHFQLSTNPPETHDMPGAVSLADRPRALVEHPDPRLVLGPLY